MKSGFALLLAFAFAACSDPAEEPTVPLEELEAAQALDQALAEAAEPEVEAMAEAPEPASATDDERPAFNRAMLGAYISVGDPVSAFPPGGVSYLRGGDSPALLVTPRMTEQMPAGYSFEMRLPVSVPSAPLRAEEFGARVSDEGGETFDVRGTVTIRELDFASGQVSFVVSGVTPSGVDVDVEVDARVPVRD
ncbi:MAG: hypothetical protein AB8H86_10710 [Polyangiales bacterium]